MRRSRLSLRPTVILLLTLLAACAGKNDLQQPAQNFFDAASALSAAEPKLLSDVNAAAIELKQSEIRTAYISDKSFENLAPAALIPSAQINMRVDATKALQLYAQKILALTGGQPDKDIDTYSEALAKNLQSGVSGRWSGVPTDVSAGVGAALSAVLQIAVDHKAFTSIVDAAKSAQTDVEKLAQLIKDDNALLGDQLKGMASTDEIVRLHLLETIRKDKRVAVDRQYAMFDTVMGTGTRATGALDELTSVSNLADALVRANGVLAKGDTASFSVLANDAFRRGVDAYNVFQQSKK